MDAQPAPSSDLQLLQVYLSAHDAPCPVCRYNLRGLESSRCPECGAALDLRVGSDDLRLGPWIVSLLGVMLPLGFIGFYWIIMSVVVVISLINRAGETFLSLGWALLTACVTLYALLLWRVIRGRRRLMKRSVKSQWIIAVCWLVFSPLSLIVLLVVGVAALEWIY